MATTRDEVEALLGRPCRVYTDSAMTTDDTPLYFTNGPDGTQPLCVGFKSGWIVELDGIRRIEHRADQ